MFDYNIRLFKYNHKLLKEKKVLEEGDQNLAETIRRTAGQRDQLADELRLYVVKHGQLESQVIRLEAALEKVLY